MEKSSVEHVLDNNYWKDIKYSNLMKIEQNNRFFNACSLFWMLTISKYYYLTLRII